MNRYQENCASVLSFNLSKKVIMIFHHVFSSKGFFLTEKNFCFKNFLFKKFFFLIVLAVFSTACNSSSDSSSSSSGDSSSSNTPKDQKTDSPPKKPQVTISTCSITQFQDEASRKKPIASMKDLDVGQKLKFFYDCGIAKKDYGKTATLAVSDDTVIQASVTEIKLRAQDNIAGSFSVTAKKAGKTSLKIDLVEFTELALTVTPTFDLDKTKIKIEEISANGLTALGSNVKKLGVLQNTLYLLESTGGTNEAHAKFYSSSDGKDWKELSQPTDNGKNVAGMAFDTTVHAGKLWVVGSQEFGNPNVVWNFDGTNWKRIGTGIFMSYFGSLVSFEDTLYLVGGESEINAYDGSQWNKKFKLPNRFGRIDALVFRDKIWIIGGSLDNKTIQTVSTFDGKNYPKAADLPKVIKWSAVEVFPRGLLSIGGSDDSDTVSAVFYSRFGTSWKEITGITKQDELKGVLSGGTVVWNDALWAINMQTKKVLKITYE